MNDFSERPHRRYDPLRDRWVLVSPHRTQRPWEGQLEEQEEPAAAYEPDCYLCPGNGRASGDTNPDYGEVFIFDNDFPALLEEKVNEVPPHEPLFSSQPVRGRCRVICYSPRHNLSLGQMSPTAIRAVIDAWAGEVENLHRDYPWVQVFENRGAAMGCSNPHPHGQIWAVDYLPVEAAIEDRQQRAHLENSGTALLLDYAQREQALGERVVLENEHWLAVVPYWATWPFELLLLPLQPVPGFLQLRDAPRDSLAAILRDLLGTYDRLFATAFPYSMGWHGAPAGAAEPHWQLHAHFYPPLLRSASVRKHMVGFEMLAEGQRDITPEVAAQRLRAAADAGS